MENRFGLKDFIIIVLLVIVLVLGGGLLLWYRPFHRARALFK